MTTVDALERTYRLFLSHAREDRPFAGNVARVLSNAAPVKVFTDDMLSPAGAWKDQLRAELEECDVFLVIGTPRSASSDFVLQEMGGAWALGKPIVVVKPEKGRHTAQILSGYAARQVSLGELETPGFLEDLLADLAPTGAE